MKRYGQYEGSTYVMEDNSEGEWVKHSEAEGIINKLKEQNKEMLEALKETTVKMEEESIAHNWDKVCPARNRMEHNKQIIQKVEGE